MKNLYKSLSVLILLLLFNSCTKEVAVNSSFDFALNQQVYTKQIVVNLSSKNVIEIVPEKEVTTASYSYKYEILKGSGAIYDELGTVISPNVYQEIDQLSFDFNYKSTQIGVENIRITVKNNDSKTTVLEYSHEIIQNDYQLNLTAPKLETTINKETLFNVVLANNGSDKTVTFQQSISLESGNAKVFDANNNEIELNKFKPTATGTNTFKIVFSTPESSLLRVETKDSNGQIQRQTITFSVNPIDFSFAAYAVETNANVNEEISLRFELTKETNNKEDYVLLFEQTSNGVFTYNGTVYQVGSPIPITKADAQAGTWNATYKGTEAGSNNLKFKLSTNYSATIISNLSLNFSIKVNTLQSLLIRYFRQAIVSENTTGNITLAKWNMAIDLRNIVYTGDAQITQIEVNGILFSINQNITIGSIDIRRFNRTSTRPKPTCTELVDDTNLTAKKNSDITIRVLNNENVYSNYLTIKSPINYSSGQEIINDSCNE